MRLWHTKTVWERLARQDPYWAVLTDPQKTGNQWERDEFFATGQKTVEEDIAYLRSKIELPGSGRVLDFGCGVGRLSQALAAHFDEVHGVDIAEPMIELAKNHNQHGPRVAYHHNPASDLRLFPDNHFDLIYSVITLQHIPAPLIRGYLHEFCRICRPGGFIYFQLPSTEPSKRWRFSWYLPTTWMRIKRFLLRKTMIRPIMSMNSLKKSEVLGIINQNHAKLVNIRPDNSAAPHQSWTYLFQKGSGRDL